MAGCSTADHDGIVPRPHGMHDTPGLWARDPLTFARARGNAAVKAGKYINDNVYLGVQTGQDTEATINLDITDSLTARGSVDSNGDTALGIFFERDY